MFLSLRRWDPAREMERFNQEMQNLFSGSRGAVHAFPPMNVWAGEDSALLVAEVPGLEPDQFDISVVNDEVTVRGGRQKEAQKSDCNCVRNERVQGEFTRTLRLPFRVDSTKVEADYKNGILSVRLPRAEEDKPRKIQIKAA